MKRQPKVGECLNENYRVVGLVGELAIVKIVPSLRHKIQHIQYFVRVGRYNYLRSDGSEGCSDKALFDTQEEAEQFAQEEKR